MSEILQIANRDLRPEMIPGPRARWRTISWFALSFNGYIYWGSLEKTAKVAKNRNLKSLTAIRTRLFFAQRSLHFTWHTPSSERRARLIMRALVEDIREKVVDKCI